LSEETRDSLNALEGRVKALQAEIAASRNAITGQANSRVENVAGGLFNTPKPTDEAIRKANVVALSKLPSNSDAHAMRENNQNIAPVNATPSADVMSLIVAEHLVPHPRSARSGISQDWRAAWVKLCSRARHQ
jgi:predicted RecA/RadA family phage recombinase